MHLGVEVELLIRKEKNNIKLLILSQVFIVHINLNSFLNPSFVGDYFVKPAIDLITKHGDINFNIQIQRTKTRNWDELFKYFDNLIYNRLLRIYSTSTTFLFYKYLLGQKIMYSFTRVGQIANGYGLWILYILFLGTLFFKGCRNKSVYLYILAIL